MKFSKALVASILLLLAVGGGVAVALSPGSDGKAARAPATQRYEHYSHKVTAVNPQLVRRLRIFRMARPSDAKPVPAATKAGFSELARISGANLVLARQTNTPMGAFYVVPGDDQVCQIGGGAMACGDISRLGETGTVLFGTSLADGQHSRRVSGIVPDTVTRIQAVEPDGTSIDVPISESAFASVVPDSVSRLVYTTTSGSVTTEVPPVPAAPPNVSSPPSTK